MTWISERNQTKQNVVASVLHVVRVQNGTYTCMLTWNIELSSSLLKAITWKNFDVLDMFYWLKTDKWALWENYWSETTGDELKLSWDESQNNGIRQVGPIRIETLRFLL